MLRQTEHQEAGPPLAELTSGVQGLTLTLVLLQLKRIKILKKLMAYIYK